MTLAELISALSASNPYRDDRSNIPTTNNTPIANATMQRLEIGRPPVLAMEADTPPEPAPYIEQAMSNPYTSPAYYRGPITNGPPNTPAELARGPVQRGTLTPEQEAYALQLWGAIPNQVQSAPVVAAPILSQEMNQRPVQVAPIAPAPVLSQETNQLPVQVAPDAPAIVQTGAVRPQAAPVVAVEPQAAPVASPAVVATPIRNEMSPPSPISTQQENPQANRPPPPRNEGAGILSTVGQNLRQLVPNGAAGVLSQAGEYMNAQFRPGDPDFLQRLGNGLAVAGSQDPFKALMMLRAQQAEDQKIRQARIKAMQGETKPLGDNGVMIEYNPDGSVKRTYIDEVIARASREAQERQMQIKKNTIDYTADVTTERDRQRAAEADKAAKRDAAIKDEQDAKKTASKAAEDAIPVLNDVKGLSERWKEALKLVGTQGTAAQLQGIPFISGIAGFFGGDEVAKNKFLEGLTVDETLLNTARTKGAISNQEMTLFKSPIPSVTDDREKVWKPWIEKRLEVLTKLEKFYEGQVARSAPAAASSSGTAAPTRPVVPGLSEKASKYFN